MGIARNSFRAPDYFRRGRYVVHMRPCGDDLGNADADRMVSFVVIPEANSTTQGLSRYKAPSCSDTYRSDDNGPGGRRNKQRARVSSLGLGRKVTGWARVGDPFILHVSLFLAGGFWDRKTSPQMILFPVLILRHRVSAMRMAKAG